MSQYGVLLGSDGAYALEPIDPLEPFPPEHRVVVKWTAEGIVTISTDDDD